MTSNQPGNLKSLADDCRPFENFLLGQRQLIEPGQQQAV
jgi:hypothetical protein